MVGGSIGKILLLSFEDDEDEMINSVLSAWRLLSFASSVLIIYVLVRVVSFLLDKKEAGDMMALLTKYQESNLK